MQIDTSKITGAELELLQWQFGGGLGSFKESLWKCIENADNTNLGRLKAGFPEQVDAYLQYIGKTGYWADVLIRAGLAEPAKQEQPPAAAPPDPIEPPGDVPPDKPQYDH